ncbi:hypothetical protein SDC9_166017 [bioreactor metagenome]|uniref:Uncharacterized protein n=1 Tax=bioreactor metagenome TaxID=1076179 RepID=A0A645FW28_9ZZZZ
MPQCEQCLVVCLFGHIQGIDAVLDDVEAAGCGKLHIENLENISGIIVAVYLESGLCVTGRLLKALLCFRSKTPVGDNDGHGRRGNTGRFGHKHDRITWNNQMHLMGDGLRHAMNHREPNMP